METNSLTEFNFQPMHPQYRAKDCRHVGCTEPATQVRWNINGNGDIDKSSKTFVCESHLESKQL